MKTKYQIISELEDRNIEIDREIDKLIQEKLNNKEKIEQLSSFNKDWNGKEKQKAISFGWTETICERFI